MRKFWVLLIATVFLLPGCVSDLVGGVKTAGEGVRDTVTWTGDMVWSGSKWVYNEARYGLGADRPDQLDLNNSVYSVNRYTDAYVVEVAAQPFLGYAFDRAKVAKKSEVLTPDEVSWILWYLDGEDKDLYVSEKDAREGFTLIANMAGAAATNPFNASVARPSARPPHTPPATPAWIE